mmetsp:Transcript_18788/g.41033  ORF Transcript_18788/g.41033 Transcript_18788/m.41033 type:complete len:294 (+) Transcript_18788:124-1005(+)
MAHGASFDFLSSSWGIELTTAAKSQIQEYVEQLSRKNIEEYVKDSDLRKLGVTSKLPKDIKGNCEIPVGAYLVQVIKIVDITQPTKFQEDYEGGKWSLLHLDLTDGTQKLKALEYSPIKGLSVKVPPGSKIVLYSTERSPLKVRNGFLLLQTEHVEILGGYVGRLVDSWKANEEVKETRLLWRTEGAKKKTDGEGPPPWMNFDPKKAPRGGKSEAELKKAATEEKLEWRRNAGGTKSIPGKEKEPEEKQGARFQVQEFAAEGEATLGVKTSISASAFKQDESRGKGKGKGKGK